LHVRPQRAGRRAPCRRRRHPIHVALGAEREPLAQALACLRRGVGIGDAAGVEAEFERLAADVARERQKSSSA
jgi:hypothetical protein